MRVSHARLSRADNIEGGAFLFRFADAPCINKLVIVLVF